MVQGVLYCRDDKDPTNAVELCIICLWEDPAHQSRLPFQHGSIELCGLATHWEESVRDT